jgi:hypothetical protein
VGSCDCLLFAQERERYGVRVRGTGTGSGNDFRISSPGFPAVSKMLRDRGWVSGHIVEPFPLGTGSFHEDSA